MDGLDQRGQQEAALYENLSCCVDTLRRSLRFVVPQFVAALEALAPPPPPLSTNRSNGIKLEAQSTSGVEAEAQPTSGVEAEAQLTNGVEAEIPQSNNVAPSSPPTVNENSWTKL